MYQTPKARLAATRDDQRALVSGIVTGMKKFSSKPRVQTVWNDCLQRYVQIR